MSTSAPFLAASASHTETDHVDRSALASAACGVAALAVVVLPVAWLAAPLLGVVALVLALFSWQRRSQPHEYGHLVAIVGAVTGAMAVMLGVLAALVVLAAAW